MSLFFQALLHGKGLDLVRLFRGEPHIEDPTAGRVEDVGTLTAYATRRAAWLRAHFRLYEHLASTASASRIVEEGIFHLDLDGRKVRLPVAFVGDLSDTGGLRAVRIYHSHFPLCERHEQRPPLVASSLFSPMPTRLEAYLLALAAGEVETIVGLFEPGGLVREPSGEPFAHVGAAACRQFYSRLLAVGPMTLEPGTLTSQGPRSILEYTVTAWGDAAFEAQPALLSADFGADGRLRALRIYDDIAQPEPIPVPVPKARIRSRVVTA